MASVQSILCGAAPVSLSSAETFTQKVDRRIFFQEVYGMTEVLMSHLNPINATRLGNCGKTLPNIKVKVVDIETGESLPANHEGELCFMSPSRMTGYINNEAATRETIDADGWVHSGDIVYYDADAYFTIVDRCKEFIKVKELQVAPSELEEVILQHPKVKEVGVVGVPHDRLGEAPRAYVVTSSPATEKEIQEDFETRLCGNTACWWDNTPPPTTPWARVNDPL
ncbi:4-coumarate--CoA ligase [Chionoecetes opilio]|uniref:4-coumarate--CoA ligase n=1 Tax=Chionoecetes opilio TaxID=41210 RepID=A0A8J5CIC1_CHIOP|nr:4-coumarate--CoA ligase [Chionoecetes opilio]